MNSTECSREDRRTAAKWLMHSDSLPTSKTLSITVPFTIKIKIRGTINLEIKRKCSKTSTTSIARNS